MRACITAMPAAANSNFPPNFLLSLAIFSSHAPITSASFELSAAVVNLEKHGFGGTYLTCWRLLPIASHGSLAHFRQYLPRLRQDSSQLRRKKVFKSGLRVVWIDSLEHESARD